MNSPTLKPSAHPCLSCGYDLRGLGAEIDVCPECGGAIDRREKQYARARLEARTAGKRSIRLVIMLIAAIAVSSYAYAYSDLRFVLFTLGIVCSAIVLPSALAFAVIASMTPQPQRAYERHAWLANSFWFVAPWATTFILMVVSELAALVLTLATAISGVLVWSSGYTYRKGRMGLETTGSRHLLLVTIGTLTTLGPLLVAAIYVIWAIVIMRTTGF